MPFLGHFIVDDGGTAVPVPTATPPPDVPAAQSPNAGVPVIPSAAAVAAAVATVTIIGPAADAPFYTPPSVPPAEYISPGQQAVLLAALAASGAPLPPDVVYTPPTSTAPPPDESDADAAARVANANDPDLSDLPGWQLDDPFGLRTLAASNPPLKGMAAVSVLAQSCSTIGVDAFACFANALLEGAGGGIGDSGDAYGPFQIHATDGRLPQFEGKGPNSAPVNAWAWSQNGLEYAVRAMATASPSAKGLTGHAAVYAIVYGFERPRDEAGAYSARVREYDHIQGLGSGWVDYVAGKMAGPSAGGATSAVPGSSAAPAPRQPAGVMKQWSKLVDVFAVKVPAGSASIKSNANSLVGVFK